MNWLAFPLWHASQKRTPMRMYSLCTPSHAVLRDEWFLPSVCDDFDIEVHLVDIEGAGRWRERDFLQAVRHKGPIVLDAVEANWGSSFVYSDVDIQFFAPVEERLRAALGDHDLVAQRDDPKGTFNAGFYIARGNAAVRDLFQELGALLRAHPTMTEQPILNEIVRRRGLNVGYLPVEFFGGGSLTGRRWQPGDLLDVPADVVMHHANFTVGIEDKIAQLRYVRSVVEERARTGP